MLALLAASLVQPIISSVIKSISGREVRKEGRRLVLLHSLENIEITNYFHDEPRLNGVFSRNKLHRTKDGACVINLDNKNSKGSHWVSLFINKNKAIYFDSFGIEYIQHWTKSKIINSSQYI